MSEDDNIVIVRELPPNVVALAPGSQGPPGPSGGSLVRVAGVNLSGHRLVVPRSDGEVIYADNATVAHTSLPIWLTLGAALAGGSVTVVALGEVIEPTWAWTPEGSIYLGANGVLTQTVPSSPARFIEQVAVAETPTSIYFDPKIPITIS